MEDEKKDALIADLMDEVDIDKYQPLFDELMAQGKTKPEDLETKPEKNDWKEKYMELRKDYIMGMNRGAIAPESETLTESAEEDKKIGISDLIFDGRTE